LRKRFVLQLKITIHSTDIQSIVCGDWITICESRCISKHYRWFQLPRFVLSATRQSGWGLQLLQKASNLRSYTPVHGYKLGGWSPIYGQRYLEYWIPQKNCGDAPDSLLHSSEGCLVWFPCIWMVRVVRDETWLCCRVRNMGVSPMRSPAPSADGRALQISRTQQESDGVSSVCSDFRRLYTSRCMPAQHRHRHFSDVYTVPQKSSPNAERWVGTARLVPHHELPPKYLLMRIWCKVAAV